MADRVREGAADKTVGRRPLDIFFHKKTYAKFRFSGEVPDGVAAVRVVFGVDWATLSVSNSVAKAAVPFTRRSRFGRASSRR